MLRLLTVLALLVTLGACDGPAVAEGEISGRAVAAPVCPVESLPPDPTCAPRPVADALVTVLAQNGRLWETRSDAQGFFRLRVPIGEVEVRFGPVEGLMGIPAKIQLDVSEGKESTLGEIVYDTGIR